MKLGTSIALIVLGAIAAFAVKDAIDGVNLELIGYILMGAGAIGLLLTLILDRPREHRTVSATRTDRDPNTGAGVTRSERVDNGEPLIP